MKTKTLFILAMFCTLVQGAWATDYSVGTDSELRAAIGDNGGTVIATAGGNDDNPSAIGTGSGGKDHNELDFANDLGVFITEHLYRSVKDNRVSDCRGNRYVRIKKCGHGGATASIVDGEKHNITA